MRGRYGDSKSLSVLTVSAVAGQIRATFAGFEDRRRGKNTPYSLSDAALSAFSVFFMQSPSFLDFPRTMQETLGKSNAQTLFGVYRIPCDNPIRSLLDAVAPSSAYPLFPFIFDGLQQAGIIDRYRATGQRLLLALDGVEHFPSRNLHCTRCSTRAHGDCPPIPTRRLSRFWSVPDETKSSPDLRSSSFPRTVMRNKTVKSTPRGVGWSERGRAMRPGTSRFPVTICTAMSRIAAICWRVDSSSFWSANPLRTRCCMSG